MGLGGGPKLIIIITLLLLLLLFKFLKKEILVRCPHSDMISTLSNEGLVYIQASFVAHFWPSRYLHSFFGPKFVGHDPCLHNWIT